MELRAPVCSRVASGSTCLVPDALQMSESQLCGFHDSTSGCRRSQCKFAPVGHAPAMDRPDVLDPLVEAKLEGLGHRLQIKFDRQLKELQVSIQQQQDEGRQQQEQQQQAVTAAAAVAVRSAASAEATAATVETAAEAVAARLAAVEEQLQFQATSALEFSLLQQQVESSLWDFLDPLVEQVQRQHVQQKSKQLQQQLQQQQLQEHVRWLEWQGQVAEEQPRQTADKLRRKKWAGQI